MNQTMSSEELRNHILSFLKEHKQASLATCMNNTPRSSPVQYFLGKGMDIYILSAGGDKFKAIAQNPNVCLLVNTEYISYRKIKGVQIFSRATTSEQVPELLNEAKVFVSDPYMIDHEGEKIKAIKIVPEEIVYLDSLEEGNRTKLVLKGDEVITKEDLVYARQLAGVL